MLGFLASSLDHTRVIVTAGTWRDVGSVFRPEDSGVTLDCVEGACGGFDVKDVDPIDTCKVGAICIRVAG